MFAKINSAYTIGISGIGVDVEVDVSSVGLPSFAVVGLGEGAIKESKERVRSALKHLDYNLFAKPITVNLAPADFKKDGSHFDFPIALGLLCASNHLDYHTFEDTLILGELSLDGRLKGVSGVLNMVEYAREAGLKRVFVPMQNAEEASLIPDVEIYAFETLAESIQLIKGEIERSPYINSSQVNNTEDDIMSDYGLDFSDVSGQFLVRRAAEIAAAGMHNMIMVGSPGSGKTMIARRMPTIMPIMSITESLETTKIYSAAGLLRESGKLVSTRPYVSPHHTASSIAIIGGGSKAKPGHVSIASGGILFLDEMLEFNRSVLEVLRQPLEDRFVTIARAGRTVTYPAKFMLVGAMNPCPCGYYGDIRKECTCTIPAIERYRNRLSGPLLDRIDIHVNVSSVEQKDLMNGAKGEPSSAMRERVEKARVMQKERFKDDGVEYNSAMTESMVRKYCVLNEACTKLLASAMDKYNLSARAYSKIIKTSRTIADLAGSENIEQQHVLEALQLRQPSSVI